MNKATLRIVLGLLLSPCAFAQDNYYHTPSIRNLESRSSGMKITWTSTSTNLQRHELYRSTASAPAVLLGTFRPSTQAIGEVFTHVDTNQVQGTSYAYQVCSYREGVKKCSAVKTRVAEYTASSTPTVACNSAGFDRVISISSSAALNAISATARPGDLYIVKKGIYSGPIVLRGLRGTSTKRISICGEAGAIFRNSSTSSGRVITVQDSDYMVLTNLEVTVGQKGVMVESTTRSEFSNLNIHHIGHEGLHLKLFSSHNLVKNCKITNVGLVLPEYGEGLYIGSSKNNYIGDRSDNNSVIANVFGPGVAAEAIDIKEYTSAGLIEGNTFYGDGMKGENYADSWMDVKGNGYLIKNNIGHGSLSDGFQTHVLVDGWGNGNIFEGNRGEINNNNLSAVLINIQSRSRGNVVKCDNLILDRPASQTSNVSNCTP